MFSGILVKSFRIPFHPHLRYGVRALTRVLKRTTTRVLVIIVAWTGFHVTPESVNCRVIQRLQSC